ncbi:MAG: hypothetical protein COU08_01425 [Candidatus Harrisonbacteria bacterium CG10_big_fil_rev_8_21_14_0_10_42_17]|uniref:Response regulatory domain-containing protein n=1 Tax=Candidatus Harrisonbacteria bacterium CG10_big_fil_rev_8_21_14_0_10_42_17 TaxID=1974584 RepID=A0A2M6WIL5_9BACT|nr:MAG: hypothetical protein COU08_01425 [Candidatus Harrisonbacteria bacterium CG10_big_fil_rev_8_21_14_0_10_42_17]
MSLKQPHILVVDDDEDFISIISQKLASSGFAVSLAHNGREGYDRALQLKPDLILMDVQMPEMDGIETLLKMREREELKHIKVMFLTAYGEDQPGVYETDQRYAKELGAVEYILKNEDLNAVVARIRKLLNHDS